MREIQATEAKTGLAELLRVVEHGEAVAIIEAFPANDMPSIKSEHVVGS